MTVASSCAMPCSDQLVALEHPVAVDPDRLAVLQPAPHAVTDLVDQGDAGVGEDPRPEVGVTAGARLGRVDDGAHAAFDQRLGLGTVEIGEVDDGDVARMQRGRGIVATAGETGHAGESGSGVGGRGSAVPGRHRGPWCHAPRWNLGRREGARRVRFGPSRRGCVRVLSCSLTTIVLAVLLALAAGRAHRAAGAAVPLPPRGGTPARGAPAPGQGPHPPRATGPAGEGMVESTVDTAAIVRDRGVTGLLMSSMDDLARWSQEDRTRAGRGSPVATDR